MSLINRMLRDLSSRERRPGDVLSGIELPRPGGARRGPRGGRLALLGVLIAFFSGVIWLLLPKPKAPVPPEATAAAPAAPAASMVESAPPPSGGLRLDTTLSSVPPTPTPTPRKPRRASGDAAVGGGAPAAPAPAVARPRDAKAAAAHYDDGRKALARGDETSAAEAFAAGLALDPAHRGAREELGMLRLRQGRLQEADTLAREGLGAEPGWIGYRRLAARLELARNNAAAAVALLERDAPAVARDPEYHGLLASAYQRLNRHEEAARAYQALSQLQPGVSQWWAGYGLSRDALGDASGALAAFTQARALGGLDARVLEHINRRSAALTAGG